MTSLRTPEDRLTYARIKAGYEDQKDFAAAFGIAPSTYTHHERGTRGLRPKTAEKYALLLENCSAEWLLYGKGRGPDEGPKIQPPPDSPPPSQNPAFMVLYDRLAALTENANEASAEEFGLVARPFGYDRTPRGLVQLTFHLWQQIVEKDESRPLLERVFEAVAGLEDGMRRVHQVLREVSERLKGDDGRENGS